MSIRILLRLATTLVVGAGVSGLLTLSLIPLLLPESPDSKALAICLLLARVHAVLGFLVSLANVFRPGAEPRTSLTRVGLCAVLISFLAASAHASPHESLVLLLVLGASVLPAALLSSGCQRLLLSSPSSALNVTPSTPPQP